MKCLEIGWNNGVVISFKDTIMSFDSQYGNKTKGPVFVSHAHYDHTNGFESKHYKISTKETLELYEAKTKIKPENTKTLNYFDKIKYDDIKITAYNAGHILGSSLFQIKTPYTNIVYTGDINCLNTLTTNSAYIADCDTLIIEATYGNPFYRFPEREEICNEIVNWALKQIKENRIPVFQLYSTGKAQEIISLFNNFTNIPVVVDSTIARTSEVYIRFGHKLIFIDGSEGEGKELLHRGGSCVYITSNNHNLPQTEKNIEKSIVTGWALKFRSQNAFPLSSHADYPQLINYVKTVKPAKVYTCFGFSAILAQRIKKECNVLASPLPSLRQTTLKKFLQS